MVRLVSSDIPLLISILIVCDVNLHVDTVLKSDISIIIVKIGIQLIFFRNLYTYRMRSEFFQYSALSHFNYTT